MRTICGTDGGKEVVRRKKEWPKTKGQSRRVSWKNAERRDLSSFTPFGAVLNIKKEGKGGNIHTKKG